MTDSLFHVTNYPKTEDLAIVEFRVNPELAPFLTSTTRSVRIAEQTFQGSIIKAAVRPFGKNFQAEVLATIAMESKKRGWGNVFPLTQEGIESSLEHLRSFGFTDLDILINPKTTRELEVGSEDVEIVEASWVPPDCMAVLPRQRNYFGDLLVFGEDKISFVSHNVLRGIALVVDL